MEHDVQGQRPHLCGASSSVDKPLLACAGGCKGVFAGDRYVTLDGLIWCEHCLTRVAGHRALALLQEASRQAF